MSLTNIKCFDEEMISIIHFRSNLQMDEHQFQSMWNMMKENNFELVDINSEYLCAICKRILINAYSAPCGCHYCAQCITEYFKEGGKICPGNSDFCNNVVINIDSDLQVNQSINTSISRLIVKCPYVSCQIRDEIISIGDHLRICQQGPQSCLLANIGCEKYNLLNENVSEHLLTEVLSHTKLLVKWINSSQIETELLKREVEKLKSDNNDLQGKIERTEVNN